MTLPKHSTNAREMNYNTDIDKSGFKYDSSVEHHGNIWGNLTSSNGSVARSS